MEMVDLNPDMVAMENFDDDEFDQYLPPNGHVHPSHHGNGVMAGRVGPGPPPPYGASSTTATTWANSCRLSTTSAGTGLPASGILQRMASNQAGSPTASLSPRGGDMRAAMQSNGSGDASAAYRTNSDSDSASSPKMDGTHAHMTSYPREQKFTYDMDHMARYYQHIHQQQQQQQQHQQQQHEAAGTENEENFANYGASQQYYGHVMQPSVAAPPYQCIPSGVKQVYGAPINAASPVNSVQWNKYGRP